MTAILEVRSLVKYFGRRKWWTASASVRRRDRRTARAERCWQDHKFPH